MDSRAYALQDGTLIRLTLDHTFAQYRAEQGFVRQKRGRIGYVAMLF